MTPDAFTAPFSAVGGSGGGEALGQPEVAELALLVAYARPARLRMAAMAGPAGATKSPIGFKIRNRLVSDFFFNMHMECHNTDTNLRMQRDPLG
jgi:hypothetical protein